MKKIILFLALISAIPALAQQRPFDIKKDRSPQVVGRMTDWAWIDPKSDDRSDDGFVTCIFAADLTATLILDGTLPYPRPHTLSITPEEDKSLRNELAKLKDPTPGTFHAEPMVPTEDESFPSVMAQPFASGPDDSNYIKIEADSDLGKVMARICKRLTLKLYP